MLITLFDLKNLPSISNYARVIYVLEPIALYPRKGIFELYNSLLRFALPQTNARGRKMLITLFDLNNLPAISNYARVIYVLEPIALYPRKGIFELYNSRLRFALPQTNARGRKMIIALFDLKNLPSISNYARVIYVLEPIALYPRKGIFELYNSRLRFALPQTNARGRKMPKTGFSAKSFSAISNFTRVLNILRLSATYR